jgi:hypothetical protein
MDAIKNEIAEKKKRDLILQPSRNGKPLCRCPAPARRVTRS